MAASRLKLNRQARAQEVRTLAVSGNGRTDAAGDAAAAAADPVVVWRAPAPLMTASISGSVTAVGHGCTATVLLVDAADGSLTLLLELEYSQQVRGSVSSSLPCSA